MCRYGKTPDTKIKTVYFSNLGTLLIFQRQKLCHQCQFKSFKMSMIVTIGHATVIY